MSSAVGLHVCTVENISDQFKGAPCGHVRPVVNISSHIMAFTLTFLPLCSVFTDGVNVFGNAQRAAKPPYKNFAPQPFSPHVCVCICFAEAQTHTFHSQAVNGAPAWCGDCAGQCAPLCDCMPPRLRLSLDTSQPSRPADLYPTVTLSERHRETERMGER